MFKVLVLLALIAVVCSIPTPLLTQSEPTAEEPRSQVNPDVDESIKAVNGEIDPKNEKEELEGAEFGWGWKKWGWGYPSYRSYYHYPSYYYPSYYNYYPTYSSYWW